MKQILIYAANITEKSEEGIKVIPNINLYRPKRNPEFWDNFLKEPTNGVLASLSYNKSEGKYTIYPGDLIKGIPVQYNADKPPALFAKGFFAGKAKFVKQLDSGDVTFQLGIYSKPDWINISCYVRDRLASTVLNYAEEQNVSAAGTIKFKYIKATEEKPAATYLNLNVDDFSLLGGKENKKKQNNSVGDWGSPSSGELADIAF